MANLMQWGSDWFHDMRNQHLSQTITYSRPGKFTIAALPATFSRTTRTLDDGNGVLVAYESWAFVIRRADLVDGATRVTPAVGDVLSYVRDGVTYKYDVTNQGGEACWRDHDRFKHSIVVYTDHYQRT